jgi:hypothetical protein
MTTFPAYCPRCRSLFPFKGIHLGAGRSLGLTGNVTNCPVCGFGQARISDGVYKATQDAVELLSGPESTRVMLEALKAVAERLKAGEISQDEAIKEAREISPRYAALIEKITLLGIPWVGYY